MADSRAAALSPAYAAGGAEYYSMMMQRNMALRSLHTNGEVGYHSFFHTDTVLYLPLYR
jgi:hypothetical protein